MRGFIAQGWGSQDVPTTSTPHHASSGHGLSRAASATHSNLSALPKAVVKSEGRSDRIAFLSTATNARRNPCATRGTYTVIAAPSSVFSASTYSISAVRPSAVIR